VRQHDGRSRLAVLVETAAGDRLVDLDVEGDTVGGEDVELAAGLLDQAGAGLEGVLSAPVDPVRDNPGGRRRPGHSEADPQADQAVPARAHAFPPTYTLGTRGPIRVTIS
jgi:hypothetical protein